MQKDSERKAVDNLSLIAFGEYVFAVELQNAM